MKKSIGALASIAFIGFLLDGLLRYGTEIVIARALGPEALGLFSFGLMIVHLSGIVARAGLDQAAQKYIPLYEQEDSNGRILGLILLCLGGTFLIGVVFSIGLFLISQLGQWDITAKFGSSIYLFLYAIPLFALVRVGASTTRGFKETKYSVYIQNIGQPLTGIIFITTAAVVFSSIHYVIVGYILSLIIGVVLVVYYLYSHLGIILSARPEFEVRRITVYAIPLFLIAASQKFMSWTDVLMLGYFESVSNIGIYQAAFRTTVMLTIVLGAANAIFPATAADLYHDGNHEQLEQIYQVTTKWVVHLTALGFIFLTVFSSDILRLFGESFSGAQSALITLGFAQVVAAIAGPAGYLLSMSEYERLEVANTIVASVLNIGLNFVLIQEFGIVGAAVATGASLAILNVARLIEVMALFNFHPYSINYWKGFLAISCSFPVMLLSSEYIGNYLSRIFLSGIISLGVFALIVAFLGFEKKDQLLIESIE